MRVLTVSEMSVYLTFNLAKPLLLSDGFLALSRGQGCYQQIPTTRTALDLQRNILHATARTMSGHALVLGIISDYVNLKYVSHYQSSWVSFSGVYQY
jgi:hypothetical protein